MIFQGNFYNQPLQKSICLVQFFSNLSNYINDFDILSKKEDQNKLTYQIALEKGFVLKKSLDNLNTINHKFLTMLNEIAGHSSEILSIR